MKKERIFLFSTCALVVCVSVWHFTAKNKNPDDVSDKSGYVLPGETELQKPSFELNVKNESHADAVSPKRIQNGDNRFKTSGKNILKKKDAYDLLPGAGHSHQRPEQADAGQSSDDELRFEGNSSAGQLNEESRVPYDDAVMEDDPFDVEESSLGERRVLEIEEQIDEAVLRDYDQFSEKEIDDISDRYEEGVQQIDTEEGRRILADLYGEYPASNRGGCAAMNLAVYYYNDDQPEKAMALVESLIESETKSVYFNGVQVLPAAYFLKGKLQTPDEARETFERLLEEFPDAIDSDGNNYAILIEELSQN
jgi:hypothetical protein